MKTDYNYVGNELDVFSQAQNWKRYWSSRMQEHLLGDLLEVGAGLGANLGYLVKPRVRSVTALEPDERLAVRIPPSVNGLTVQKSCGFLVSAPLSGDFDTIVYIDVLEHIADDRAEVGTAWRRLRSKGRLIFLCPAFEALWSPFDDAVGHERRYTLAMARDLLPSDGRIEELRYLDSTGAFASLMNRFCLRKDAPSAANVALWDRWLVPVSRCSDLLFCRLFGKSVLAIFQKQ